MGEARFARAYGNMRLPAANNKNLRAPVTPRFLARVLLAAVLAWSCASIAGINAFTQTGPEGGPINTIAFHPTQPNTVFAAGGWDLYRSTDNGTGWQRVIQDSITSITDIKFDPTNANRVIVLNQALARSTDGGATFGNFTVVDNEIVASVDFSPNGHLFAVSYSGRLFRSTDAGVNWTQLTVPWTGTQNLLRRITADPNNFTVLYAMIPGVGTYKTVNAGGTWTLLAGSPGSRNEADLGWVMAIKPGDSNILLVVTSDGLMRSPDGGATWSTLQIGAYLAWVAFDPLTPTNAVAVTHLGEVMRSHDSGASWPPALKGAQLRTNYFTAGAMHPGISGRLFFATTDGPMYSANGGDSFDLLIHGIRTARVHNFSAAANGIVYAGLMNPARVYRRGADWQPVNSEGLFASPTAPLDLSGMATSWGNSSVLYAADFEGRVMRSTDSGNLWSVPSPSLAHELIYDLAADPADPKIAHVATLSGLWRTIDGGDTWQHTATLPTFAGRVVTSVVDPLRVYAASYAPPRVYVSPDRGANWTLAKEFPGGQLLGIDVDPTDAQTLYVYLNSTFWKSLNGGVDWQNIIPIVNGTPIPVGANTLVDPQAPGTIILPTSTTYRGFIRSIDGGATWDRTPLDIGGDSYVETAILLPDKPTTLVTNYSGLGVVEYTIGTDLELNLSSGADFALDHGSPVRFTITNLGPHSASPSQLRLQLPGWLTPGAIAGCTFAAPNLNCSISALHLTEARTLEIPMHSSATPSDGVIDVQLVTHEDDIAPGNNALRMLVRSIRISDLGIAGSPTGIEVAGAAFTRTLTVTNDGPNDSPTSTLALTIPAGYSVVATTTRGSCTIAASNPHCDLGAMPAAATATITLTVTVGSPGSADLVATIATDAVDQNSVNNLVMYGTQVVAPQPQSSSSSGGGAGGGGGRLDWLALALLGGALLRRGSAQQGHRARK